MEYMLASSRHHLLPKEGKSARPRYHIYFPISEITDAEVYGNLKKALQKEYPFFDGMHWMQQDLSSVLIVKKYWYMMAG